MYNYTFRIDKNTKDIIMPMNRWFQIQYLKASDNVDITRPVEVINPSIDKYPLVSGQGYLFDEFKAYDNVIAAYLHVSIHDYQGWLQKYCNHASIKPTRIIDADWHALDWEDLKELPLSHISQRTY